MMEEVNDTGPETRAYCCYLMILSAECCYDIKITNMSVSQAAHT